MDLSNHPCIPEQEDERLAALAELGILDTKADEELDNLTKIAALAMRTKSAAISLVDKDRQWFKSRVEIQPEETPRDMAFCHFTVAQRRILVVRDATTDPRFSDNPLVTQAPNIRFYAGVPLFLSSGHCVGSLCVIDYSPRPDFDERDLDVLEHLATLTVQFIENRRGKRMGEIAAKVVSASVDAILAADRKGSIVYWNTAAERMFGYSQEEALGNNVKLIIPRRFHSDHQDIFERAAAGGLKRIVGTSVDLEGRRADGQNFPLELSLAPWSNSEEEGGFAAIIRDISDRKALEADRRETRAFLDTIVTNLPAMLFVKDAQTNKYLLVNRKAEEIVGRSADSMIGLSDAQLFPGIGEAYENRDKIAVASGSPHVHESEFVRDDGRRFHLRTTRVLVDGNKRRDQYLLGMSEDMTDFRKAEEENYRLARYDSLTGMLNRTSSSELLHDMVQAKTPFAMLSIDLDRFKAVNDQFGHITGDEVLEEVACRLSALAGTDDRVARVGGDEFVAILPGDQLRKRASAFADQVIEQISLPIQARGGTAHIGASVGIALYPEDSASIEKLRENADLALYRAKKNDRGTACFFDDEMDRAVRDRRTLENDLRHAVEECQIGLQYQPVISAATGLMTSVEALARWTHSSRGPIPPEGFISLAEDCGLIEVLGAQLLKQACCDALTWRSELRIAVNLSPLQFRSGGLLTTVRETLEETGIAPERLLLEVTERLVIDDPELAFEQLEQLRALGIQLLMDDFGVGHSSLSYFQRFRFDKVKIDKSFIAEIETSKAANAIVEAVVGLGRNLSMGIVAEGVETERQRQSLTDLGCTHLQGYLFSKPVDASEIRTFLDREGKSNLRDIKAA